MLVILDLLQYKQLLICYTSYTLRLSDQKKNLHHFHVCKMEEIALELSFFYYSSYINHTFLGLSLAHRQDNIILMFVPNSLYIVSINLI